MQPCNRIYYSKVYWRLNMFRASHRSSSGALNCICSLWFIYTCGDRPLPALTTAGHHMGIKTRSCKYGLELLMMSGMPLETCWAFNKRRNNKLYYKVAFCWLFLLRHNICFHYKTLILGWIRIESTYFPCFQRSFEFRVWTRYPFISLI